MEGEARRLSRCRVGGRYAIRRLEIREERLLRRLQALGVAAAGEIELVRKFPAYVVVCGGAKLAFDRRIAAGIWVTEAEGGARFFP